MARELDFHHTVLKTVLTDQLLKLVTVRLEAQGRLIIWAVDSCDSTFALRHETAIKAENTGTPD